MIPFTSTTTIARGAADVWSTAADLARHAEWMDITESVLTSGDGASPGSRARQTMRLGPVRLRYELEVADAEPGRRIAWRTVGGGALRAGARLELEALSADSTRVTWSGEMGFRGPLRLLEPLIAAEARAGEARELERLRALLEPPPPS
jgi:carbon monoxide dehydrogenase subunit G